MKTNKAHTWLLIGGLAIVLSTGAYLLWWKPKKETKSNAFKPKGNPVPDKAPKPKTASIVTEPNWQNPFDMNYARDVLEWVVPKSILSLNTEKAKLLAKQLKAAKGNWNDDEQAVESVFAKQLKDKVQVANLSQAFWQLYKTDMWEYLNSFLSKSEMEKYVHQPVRKLANYRVS